MAKLEEIKEMMRAQKTPHLRIYNMSRERIFTFENDDVEATILQMDQLLPYISSYGRVEIEAATQAIKNRKYTGAYWWKMEFDKSAAPAVAVAGAIPTGYVHQDMLAKEIAILNLKFEHEKEMRQLNEKMRESEKNDPVKIIEKFAPVAMYAMGKPAAEIAQLMNVYNNPNTLGAGAIAGPQAKTHVLKFKDVENLTPDQKHAKLQAALDELSKHCSLEHTILLVEGLCAKLDPKKGGNPEFINTILTFL